jgi:hypothetical protein
MNSPLCDELGDGSCSVEGLDRGPSGGTRGDGHGRLEA